MEKKKKELPEVITKFKRADEGVNKIIIPKYIIDNFDREFIMEINTKTGVMKLTPLSQMKKGDE